MSTKKRQIEEKMKGNQHGFPIFFFGVATVVRRMFQYCKAISSSVEYL